MGSELYHYGVKGMKWGVRKSDRESRRESGARKLESKAADYRSKSKALESKNTRSARRKQSRLAKKEDQALRDAEAKRQGKLTRNQKLVVAGAAVVATYAAYKIGRNIIESGELNRQIMKGKAFLEKTEPSFNKNPVFARKNLDADQLNRFVASGVNNIGSIGSRGNCRRCTLTYEMRRRGYDVKATRTTNARGQAAEGLYNITLKRGEKFVRSGFTGRLSRMAKEEYSSSENTPFSDFMETVKSAGGRGKNKIDLDSNPLKRSKNIFDALSKEPDGARGELGIGWTAGSGHSVAWEIVKGRPVIFDTQTGKHFEDSDSFTKYASRIATSGYTRLDNVELNQDFLMRWMKNA